MYDDPNSIDQGSRSMFANGQLVQPSDDGSRPGYSGDNVRKLRSGVEVSSKKTKVFKYPRKNFKGEINYYKTPQITRAGIEGVPDNVGTKLARPKDGKSFQILHYPDGAENKPKLSLFKTEKQAVDFYNKNVKKGSGAQVKDTFDKQSKEFKDFFKDPKIYRRYYNGPLNASSINKIWLNLSSENKRQAKELLGTQDKNIKEAKELTKKGYIKVTDLAGELDRSPDEVLRSMKTSKKFNKLFPNYLDGLKTASNGTKWIKTTPSTLTKLKQWADDPLSKGLSDKTIKNVLTAYKDEELMNYWKKWKPGTPIDQELVDSVHGKKGSANTMMQLGRTLQGKESIDGIKKNKFLGDKIIEAVRYKSKEFGDWHTAAYKYAKQDMDTFLPPGKSGTTFGDYQRLLTKSLKEVGLEDFQVDEINALRAGVRGGTQPYSVFTNILKGKYNQGEKRRFDAENAKNQMKLNRALAMGDDETITVSKKKMNKKEYIDYVLKLQNNQVDNFFKKVPELKGKISLPKFDLRDPRTVYGARFNTFDPTLQNSILKNFEEIGYTIDVGKKAKTQKELLRSNLLKLAGQIDPDCKQAIADGGRIGLKTIGSPNVCITKARNYMSEELTKGIGIQQNAKTSLIKRILTGSANILKQNLSPKELFKMENLIGKPALYGAAAFETGLVADDVLRKGKPLNVAAAESLFGSVLNLDANAARAKNLLESNTQLSPAAKEYAQNILDYDKYRKLDLSFPSSLVAKSMPGSEKYFKMQEDIRKKIESTPDTGAFDYQSALDESEGAFKAKPKFLDAPDAPDITPLTNKFAQPPRRRVGPMTAKQDIKIDLTPLTYQNFKPDYGFTKEQFEDAMRKEGVLSDDQVYKDDFYRTEIEKPIEFEQLMKLPSFRGASEKFAGGGIAGLSGGIDEGPQRRSMNPDSQGLSYLFNRVKKV